VIAIVSAPTNLGLRPPVPGSVPGTAKAPEALREAGLHRRLLDRGAVEAGVVLPGRYVDDDGSRPTGTIRNQSAIVAHARRLASRLVELRRAGHVPLVLGGDCSLLVAAGLASRSLRQSAETAPGGLVHIDGHTDFRHPGNSGEIGSLAGEDLAAAIGLHLPGVADVDGLGPYFDATATVHVGHREDDEHADEVLSRIARVVPARDVSRRGGRSVAQGIRAVDALANGYWIQVDVDVLDPSSMPAVDSPDPGGLTPDDLVALLRGLAPAAWGAAVTVFDPDLDPDGRYARLLVDVIIDGLGELGDAHRA